MPAEFSPGQAVFRLVYRSTIHHPRNADGTNTLADILRVARARNAALGITGVLYRDSTYFAQVLEGPEAAVRTVFASIRRDRRHRDVTVLFEGPRSRRAFQGWAMAMVSPEFLAGLEQASGLEAPPPPPSPPAHATPFVALMRRALTTKRDPFGQDSPRAH